MEWNRGPQSGYLFADPSLPVNRQVVESADTSVTCTIRPNPSTRVRRFLPAESVDHLIAPRVMLKGRLLYGNRASRDALFQTVPIWELRVPIQLVILGWRVTPSADAEGIVFLASRIPLGNALIPRAVATITASGQRRDCAAPLRSPNAILLTLLWLPPGNPSTAPGERIVIEEEQKVLDALHRVGCRDDYAQQSTLSIESI